MKTTVCATCLFTRLDILEKIVWEITLKFIKVNQELKDLKKQIILQDPVNNEVDQIKETEDEIEPPKSGDNDKGVMVKSIETVQHKSQGADISSLEIKQDKVKENQTEVCESHSRDSLLKCHKCDYKYKKTETLKKHNNTKHTDHVCNICHLRFVHATDFKSMFLKTIV